MNRQEGMTMVELIMAVAVTGIIVAFLGTAVHQILDVSGYGNDRLSTQHEMQNAASWFNLDIQGAVAAAGGSQLVLTLSDDSTVTYSLTGTELRRSAGGPEITLARNIGIAAFSIDSRLATMSLTNVASWRDGVSETVTYMAYLRPAEVLP